MQVRRRDLHARQRLCLRRLAQGLEDGKLLVEWDGEAPEIGCQHRLDVFGDPFCEDGVIFIDKPVLVPECHRIGTAHADLAIGGHDGACPPSTTSSALPGARLWRCWTVVTPLATISKAENSVSSRRSTSRRASRDANHSFQRVIRGTQLEGRQADMMVRVDEARDDGLSPPADHRCFGILRSQTCGGAKGEDPAIADENRSHPGGW